MATNELLISSWKRLPLDLGSQTQSESFEDFQQLLQTAWLLLLSTYSRDSSSSCYLSGAGEHASLELLSLATDKSLTLSEHTNLIRTGSLNLSSRNSTPNTMLWYGPDPLDMEAQIHALNEICTLEFIVHIIHSPHEPGVEVSVGLLYQPKHGKFQEDDAIGRVETFKTIFSALVQHPTSVLGDVNILSDHDRKRIIAWNQPAPGSALEMTIPSGFAAHVKDRPDAPAVFAWDGEMTYKELDTASSSIAKSLHEAGKSGPDDMVLFNMRKSKWALVAALAILKSGKAIVPTDISWPQSRLRQIVEITGARLAVCDEVTKGAFDADTVCELMVPSAPRLPQINDDEYSPETSCVPDDLAFVLFSSGSTGVPKGMLRQHNTACTGSYAHAKAMHLNNTSRVLQFANHVFDVAMLDLFTTLLMGGCVCIPSEIDRKNDLAGFVERSQANWALLTPTVAGLLDPITVPSLKFVTLGGESISRATLQKWLETSRVGINYGSAEVDVTHTRDVLNDADTSNVGQRLPSCQAYIVDPDNLSAILPVGAVGELVICGPTMARGYLNAPEKTATVFTTPPKQWFSQGIFAPGPITETSRIYRMGDLCRQKSDGSLEFVGRKDFQVKVSGQKVELGDIESKLVQHSAVKQCAVIYPSQGPYAKRLVAVVESVDVPFQLSRHNRAALATKPTPLGLRSITEFLSASLPSFMMPTVFIGLVNMPYTATMKIDRNLLRSWLLNDDIYNASQGAVHQISTALEGPLLLLDEKKAVELSTLVADVVSDRHSAIWRSISGHDNSLEDIGINSAQMMRLSHMINKQFGAKVLVEMLGSKDMTIRKLAALLNCREVETIFQKSCSVDGAKVAFLQDRVAEASRTVLGGLLGLQDQSQQHVFLTGATGYLGVQILVQLLQSKHIGSVAVLVRSADEHQAMMRVKNTIAATEESIPEENLLKIRAWSGDLSKTNLGLSEIHSNEFSALGKRGRDGNKKSIDTIIHCGAVVDWRKTYRELEAANVSSTEQLLKLALKSSGVRRFVFISGGRYPDPTQEYGQNLHQMYLDTAKGSGYAQTKFVAEQLVDNVRRATHYNTSIDIVSPAYLIGSQKIGLANQDDYLWRIVWASVRIGAFNADENDQWLFVADSASLAERIVALAEQDSIASSLKNTTLQVHDGLGMQEFWRHVCDVLGVSLAPVTGEEWLRRVKEDMEGMRDHLLWPLAETIDASYGQLTQQRCLAVTMGSGIATAGIDLAIQQNIQRLKKTEFFG